MTITNNSPANFDTELITEVKSFIVEAPPRDVRGDIMNFFLSFFLN